MNSDEFKTLPADAPQAFHGASRLALAFGKAVLAHTAAEHLTTAQESIAKTGYKRRMPEAAAGGGDGAGVRAFRETPTTGYSPSVR